MCRWHIIRVYGKSLLVGVGDNPPLTPPRRGEMGMSEEVGVTIVP
ncbi:MULTISPECIES: hypothetical protein [Okeania]|nr:MULTISPECIES: hypothetical protein [Okeania]